MSEAPSTQRLDKWLWHARFAKTRSLAQKLITAGGVRVDREKITSASKTVRIGNILTPRSLFHIKKSRVRTNISAEKRSV